MSVVLHPGNRDFLLADANFPSCGVSSDNFAAGWIERKQRWDALRDATIFPRVTDAVRSLNPGSVFEAGCGDGTSARAIQEADVPHLIAGDINPGLLDQARRTLGRSVVLRETDLSERIDLDDNQVEVTVSCSVFMFLNRAAVSNALQEFRRITADHGRILLSVVHPEWTLRATERVDLERTDEHRILLPWENVNASVYYRPLSWYDERIIESGLRVLARETIRVPNESLSLGERFQDQAGQSVFAYYELSPNTSLVDQFGNPISSHRGV